jgi:di/tricarboxylate transporter
LLLLLFLLLLSLFSSFSSSSSSSSSSSFWSMFFLFTASLNLALNVLSHNIDQDDSLWELQNSFSSDYL